MIHDEMIKNFGGATGIFREGKGNIESMLTRMQEGVYSKEPTFKTLIEKVAFQFQSILQYHYFVDGTKRTGIMSSLAFLLKNNIMFFPKNDKEAIDFAKRVADELSQEEDKDWAYNEIKNWFSDRIFPIEDKDRLISYIGNKGIVFKCPRCKSESASLNKPYCPDCGLQLLVMSYDFNAIVLTRKVIFKREITRDIHDLPDQKTKFIWSITEIQ